MQTITFFVLLAIVALTSASLTCCGFSKKDGKKSQKNGQSKLKLKVNFGENEVQPESVVKILEAVGGINWQQVGTSFAPVGAPVPAPPTSVNINGKQVSASDLAALLEVLNGVNWPKFSSSIASSSQGNPTGFGHSSHEHGHEISSASDSGSQKINIGGRDFDVAHVAQLLEHMGDIDWRKVEKLIEAANAGTVQQSNSPSIGQNELPHFAKLLEKMGGIDWKKIESLVESSANQPNSGANNGHENAGQNGIPLNEYMNKHMDSFNAANHPTTLFAASQSIPEEPEHHVLPEKAKKPQSNVQRLIEKWTIPPLVEEPHFHCKENCKHCQEDIFYGEEVSAPHVTKKIKSISKVDWKSVGSSTSDKN